MFLNKNKQSVGFDAHIKLNRNIRTIGTAASVLFSVFVFLSAFPIAEPYDASAAIIPSATTLEITSTSNTLALDLDVYSTSGSYNSKTYGPEVSVTTDNITGYTLLLDTVDHTGKLTNNRIPTAFMSSITSTYTELSYFPSGTWGIKLTKNNTIGNYQPAPGANSVTLDTTDSPNSDANKYMIGIGAKANYNTPAGTYSNTLILQATGRPVLYEINYLDNTDDENVDNLPVQEASGVTPVASFTLSDEEPTRTGYEFVGWCDGEVDHTANPSTCTGTTYNPGDTYTFSGISSESTNIANLYAMWQSSGYTITFNTVNAESITFDGVTYTNGQSTVVPAGTYSLVGNYALRYAFSSWNATAGTISNPDYVDYNLNTYTVEGNATITLTGQYVETELQGLAASSCTTTPMPTYDNRDGQVYWVKRLDDGNCWMMDNMNLGAVDLTTDLTSFNTNIGGTVSAATFNSWRKDGSTPPSGSQYLSVVPLTTSNSNNGVIIDNNSGTKYGTLYDLFAVSGGVLSSDEEASDLTQDICPAGWRLSTNSQFTALIGNPSYDTVDELVAPISEGGAGMTFAGSITQYGSTQGAIGTYWSSSPSSTWNWHNMLIQSGSINLNSIVTRYYLSSVRCIRDTSMQGFSDADAAAMAEGATATLTDRRDGKTYNVAKINGDVWMTQNLRFTGANLDPVDTNVSEARTVTYSDMNSADCGSDLVTGPTMSALCLEEGTDSNGDPTVWYNFPAASAGSITGHKNLNEAVDSICPKGWRLPTTAEYSRIADNDTYKALYNPVAGGTRVGTVKDLMSGYGVWWSSTQYNEYNRGWLLYSVNSDSLTATGRTYRFESTYVRCIQGNRTINEVSYMQDVNEKVRQATPKGTSKTLPDLRDGEEYLVAKLEDDNIWMRDNMRLDPTAVDLDKLQGNTNASNEALTYYKNGGGTAPYPANAVAAKTLADGGFTGVANDPQINTEYKDIKSSGSRFGYGSGKRGVYYNLCAASAGSHCYSSGSNVGDVTSDICPKGWRLPSGGSNGEYYGLYTAYSSNSTSFMNALGANFPGRLVTDSINSEGNQAWYLTSTYYNAYNMHVAAIYSSSLNLADYDGFHMGMSVRCIAK